jgi:hypothetical protein
MAPNSLTIGGFLVNNVLLLLNAVHVVIYEHLKFQCLTSL